MRIGKNLFRKYPEKGKKFLENNYKNFENIPDEFKSSEDCEKWLENVGYHKFKDVPQEKMTQKMCEAAFKKDMTNINYMPDQYITEKMLQDALTVLDKNMAKTVLNPLHLINRKLPNEEDRLRLATLYPEAMGGCDFELVEKYYKQESKGLSPRELQQLQAKIRVIVPQYYYIKLDELFSGKVNDKVDAEVFHTDHGTITADDIYKLRRDGAVVEQLQDFHEEDLVVHGTWISQNGCLVVYEYKGEDFIYQQPMEGDPIFGPNENFLHYKGQRSHITWNEIKVYDLVKAAEATKLEIGEKKSQKDKQDDLEER